MLQYQLSADRWVIYITEQIVNIQGNNDNNDELRDFTNLERGL